MGITDTVKWKAVYNDGNFILEREPDGTEHMFKEIDMSRIKAFQLVNENGIPVCQVNLGEEKRLIFARRNQKTTGQLFKTTDSGLKIPVPTKSHQIIIILGWQKTVNGVNTKAIFYLLPDGRIEMDDEWREDATHSRVNTPGLIPEVEEPKISENIPNNETTGKSYSGSNDPAFENK